MAAFVAVAEHASFSKAASRLGISASTLSGIIRSLEDRLGGQLLVRTTRSVALTDLGEQLLRRIRPILGEYTAVVESVIDFRSKPAGRLRLIATQSAAEFGLAPRLPLFLAEYPKITVDILVGVPHLEDIAAGHFDAGISVGNQIAPNIQAICIAERFDHAIVGSPEYFSKHPIPLTPQDLEFHQCIRHGSKDVTFPWILEENGRQLEVTVDGPLIVNQAGIMVSGALAGIGLARVPLAYVEALIEEGRLISVLPDWCPRFGGLYLYYASQHHIPSRLRALIDFIAR